MISEELPAIVFTSITIISFIILLFFVISDYVSKSSEIYVYRTAETLAANEVYGKRFVSLEEHELADYNFTVAGYTFSPNFPEEYGELIVISIPCLVGNATNYGEVKIYAYK